MSERLQFSIGLNQGSGQSLEACVKQAILDHRDNFTPYFESLIDIEDARTTVASDTLEIYSIEIDADGEGTAEASFIASFYAGCKDMNSDDPVEATLPFHIEDGLILFDLELDPPWRVEH